MFEPYYKLLDWFIPEAAKRDRSDLGLARNFVFTHLAGPLLGQSMSVFLYLVDPNPGIACWTVIISIWSFWLLPFALKITKNLRLVALASVEILTFATLFGAYYYGGVSSPFLPWLIISLLLGFFYLSDRPFLVIGVFTLNLIGFFAAYAVFGFEERVPISALAPLGWISILSATIYMSWMAVYYASMMSMRSELEREADRHRATAVRLRHTKELAEKANKDKSIFLAKMSHELRTPLNAVIGYSEILLEDGEDGNGSPERIADLRRINAAGKHLLSLVTDVLDLSKIESDTVETTKGTFHLKQFVDDITGTFRTLVDRSGNRFVVDCPDNIGSVETDATKLRQATLNLLSNAIKFTNDGVISLEVRRQSRLGTDWIEISVRDTGIGIAEADLPKLFQNFRQATVWTSSKYGGTGLGLALSQKLCGMMGGSISVDSQAGHGSCFTIRVPAVLPSVEREPTDSPALPTPTLAHAV